MHEWGLHMCRMWTFLIHVLTYWGMVCVSRHGKGFWEGVRASLRNQVCCTLPASLLCRGFTDGDVLGSLCAVPLLIVVSDMYFFVTHYTMHKTWLWRYHKAHHTGGVQAVQSLDADMVEHVVCNLGSFIAPFVLLRLCGLPFNVWVFRVWVGVSTWSTCVSHLGYEAFGDRGVHHLHHKHLHCNYGTGFYILDRLCGTFKV